ncbi:MAG: hypothetical protein WAO12_06675 [Venatoribacter sp.]
MKHPGTAGLMPVKGTTCGIRPDLDEMTEDTGFDFSQAQQLLRKQQNEPTSQEKPENPPNNSNNTKENHETF